MQKRGAQKNAAAQAKQQLDVDVVFGARFPVEPLRELDGDGAQGHGGHEEHTHGHCFGGDGIVFTSRVSHH